jgi:hypothetical protein
MAWNLALTGPFQNGDGMQWKDFGELPGVEGRFEWAFSVSVRFPSFSVHSYWFSHGVVPDRFKVASPGAVFGFVGHFDTPTDAGSAIVAGACKVAPPSGVDT